MPTKKTITKRTYDRNVRKFAKAADEAWCRLSAFVEKHGPPGSKDEFQDELCSLVDGYIDLNCDILLWCHRNGVSAPDFVCDVENRSFAETTIGKRTK